MKVEEFIRHNQRSIDRIKVLVDEINSKDATEKNYNELKEIYNSLIVECINFREYINYIGYFNKELAI